MDENIINFCNGCENVLTIYADKAQKLYLGCKICNERVDYDMEETIGGKCVYRNEFNKDYSEIITNKYINFDNTLPIIEGNDNIKCHNEKCISIIENKPCNLTYIKYNEKDLKYKYLCKFCGFEWKNK
jgi:hypothetical protein